MATDNPPTNKRGRGGGGGTKKAGETTLFRTSHDFGAMFVWSLNRLRCSAWIYKDKEEKMGRGNTQGGKI